MWLQREIRFDARPRGFHLITREVVSALPELGALRVGLLHLFIRHTSASLTLNENASPDVRRDFETYFNRAVPEDADWAHTLEGPDDMPAHIKAVAARPVADAPGGRRAPGARHLAGRLPVRAPRPRRPALGAGHGLGRAGLAAQRTPQARAQRLARATLGALPLAAGGQLAARPRLGHALEVGVAAPRWARLGYDQRVLRHRQQALAAQRARVGGRLPVRGPPQLPHQSAMASRRAGRGGPHAARAARPPRGPGHGRRTWGAPSCRTGIGSAAALPSQRSTR